MVITKGQRVNRELLCFMGIVSILEDEKSLRDNGVQLCEFTQGHWAVQENI